MNKKKERNDTFTENLLVNGVTLKFQLDTGARCNVLTRRDFQALKINGPLRKPAAALRSFSGHRMVPDGMITLNLQCKEETHAVEFYVVDTKSQSILSGETAESIGLIKRIYHIEDEYSTLFQGLGCLPREVKIEIDKNAKPVVHPPRKVPIMLKDKVKAELLKMERLGVIVRQKEPTPWLNSMVTVTKPDKSVRICIDPKDLNNAIQREHYPMKTIEEVVAEMPEAKVFSTIDATSGFWQLKLDTESSKLTTFNTPFGRYRLLRAPFGIKSIPEIYQRTMTEMIEGLEGAQVIVDDILVWGKDEKDYDERLSAVLKRAEEWNLKLSEKKCQFRKDEVEYVGHKITKEGLKPDPEKVRAVQEMKQPTNTKELQTFLGFITYLQKFLPNMSQVSAPLRKLLEKDIAWHWETEQKDSFQALKKMASEAPVLAFYNKDETVVLNVDASSCGLGAVLLQNERPVAYASRALNSTMKKYSQIEKEALAIVFGCKEFHDYLYGTHFIVESDHKPLESIFKKSITEAPPRVQRFAIALQKYDFKVVHKPGKTMLISDTLSRLYLPETNDELVPDLSVNEVQLNAHLPVSDTKYNELKRDTENDSESQLLHKMLEDGWPQNKSQTPEPIQKYWAMRDEITSIDGILYKGQKVIIPKAQRKQMLMVVHETHMGVVKCKARARQFMYWPGMMTEIQETVQKCEVCAINDKKMNRKESMISHDMPDRPSAKIGADLFELKGQHYLLTVDY
ncbi:uncharacterized protein K02A2.6-like [Mya arenaria]|uniref:uncharacterized protein K02A2.6-like n=1 Tax=Mya arenaria TaxID=6604 RepID=UPI0022E3FF1D|nr:uncharacterized protein K02A2.6-like [Mya arenaria]